MQKIRIRGGYMKLKKFIVTILIYGSIFGGVNLLLAYTFVTQMEDYIQEGLLDIVDVSYTNKGSIAYEINGNPLEPFESYAVALRDGRNEQLLFAENGLALKRKSPIGQQYYVIDYSWLDKGRYDEQDIKDYVKEHRGVMLLRSSYLTDSVLYGSILFITLYALSFYLVPMLLLFLSNFYIFLKKQKAKNREIDYEYEDLAKSMISKLLHNQYDKSWDMPLMVGILSYYVSSQSVVNVVLLGDSNFIWFGLLYVALLLGLCVNYLLKVYNNLDYKRLENKMLQNGEENNGK